MTKILHKISIAFTLGCLSLIGFQNLNTYAQDSPLPSPPEEYHQGTLSISPDITAAPLFKSSTPLTLTLSNYQSTLDATPQNGAYICTFEARTMQDRDSTLTSWSNIASTIAYNPSTGCTANLNKPLRGNGLNWSIKVTISSVTDSSIKHSFYGEYAFSFQGAGVAVGN